MESFSSHLEVYEKESSSSCAIRCTECFIHPYSLSTAYLHNPLIVTGIHHFLKSIYFNWRLITLQYCSGFCHTLTWISHGCTCVSHPEPSSHLPPHPIPQGHPSAPALSNLSPCIKPGLAIYFTYSNIHVSMRWQWTLEDVTWITQGQIVHQAFDTKSYAFEFPRQRQSWCLFS